MTSAQFASLFLLVAATPALAGPCTQRIAEIEKGLTARQEGAGPALSTGSVTSGGSATVNPTAEQQSHSQALGLLREAKQFDQQGQEARCMEQVGRIEAMMPR